MKKTILYALVIFGALFVFYLLRAMWGGFSSTVNPNASFERGKCVANCRNNNQGKDCENKCF